MSPEEMDRQVRLSAQRAFNALRAIDYDGQKGVFVVLGLLVLAADMADILGITRERYLRFAKSFWDDRDRLMGREAQDLDDVIDRIRQVKP